MAGYLATVAGFVNSGGFVLIGSFTSHVTGSIGRLADDIARADSAAAAFAALLVISFFAGAFFATWIMDSRNERSGYALALLCEGLVLTTFIFVAGISRSTHPRALDAQAALLCVAMGLQNSMVTRLSGAVVRTTHLTGVMTDLAMESARWYRWHRAKLLIVPQILPGRPPVRPNPAHAMLLGTIVGTFTVGAGLGAALTLRASRWAMLAPALAILAASGYAYLQRRGPAFSRAAT